MNLAVPLQMDQFRLVVTMLTSMYATSRILENQNFIQHGTTSTFTHCRNVAFMSLKLARMFGIHVDSHSMVRGALLHDYYLYDWHDKNACPTLHGYKHPAIALNNALSVYDLNPTEVDIIAHHMFPLTIHPPKTKEGWIVSVADKLCSLYETFKMNDRHVLRRKTRLLRKAVAVSKNY